ncbi:MAG TPA: AMP-binding protein, partial [Dehalococcoidia bacterium]|nr:AMP-binding protein [Dehalococcoidia bacterium]
AKSSRHDLSSLAVISCGGDTLVPELWERASQTLRCNIVQTYGSAEAFCINTSPPGRVKPGSVGPAVADTWEKIVALDTDEEVALGEMGELLIRGPQVCKGYWRNPQANAEAITPDGWFRTGDLVRADEEGYIYIIDRKKEVIKYKGYQITPVELEKVLAEHPAVSEAAVIPKDDPQVGQIPKALVVLRPGAQVGPEELMTFVEARVAPFKKVREIEFIEAMPRSAAGKVLRRELIDRERAAGPGGPG